MKRIIIGMLALTSLAACAHEPQCMGDGDDIYRQRTRDYNWYDGRELGHGEKGDRTQVYYGGAREGQWTKPE